MGIVQLHLVGNFLCLIEMLFVQFYSVSFSTLDKKNRVLTVRIVSFDNSKFAFEENLANSISKIIYHRIFKHLKKNIWLYFLLKIELYYIFLDGIYLFYIFPRDKFFPTFILKPKEQKSPSFFENLIIFVSKIFVSFCVDWSLRQIIFWKN